MKSQAPDPAPLDGHLGYLLRTVSNAVSHAFARKLTSEGVTVAEWALLRVLYDVPGIAPAALAARMGMTRGAISKLALRLTGKGLLASRAHPDDGRAQMLELTEPGRALVPNLAAIADTNDSEFFAALSPVENATLRKLAQALITHHALTGVAVD
ncbi:MarR family winged helix-turn-helix transcriptional regulator [Alteraurantiacibacter buctensis]|uniref:MarR family transcriptional regulator n=1 Tax=Alteraurantiacibacter buctensis TaxID=1503981 RepID=A0A844Z1J6_9SPHN|nr:MarR family transcriptional regulator [Alteraurantiacibacter buctensis]MXO73116.1 MarR family transcriptional regulator [Alteraurantiacibacter buctensis]